MNDFIEALNIFLKYVSEDVRNPFSCDHDILFVTAVEGQELNEADVKRLNELGFEFDEDNGYWVSYRFGSS